MVRSGGAPRKTGFIDLHQDIVSGVARFDGGFPAYGSSYLHGPSRAAAVLSSLFPTGPESSLLAELEAHRDLLGSNGSSLRLVTTASDLDADDHRTGVLPHSEGFNLPGTDRDALEELWREHCLRSLSLTWNYETDYAYSCYEDADARLKPAGRRLLGALDESHILLDLAHINDTGFFDTLDHYSRPVLVTHSSCRGIVDHPRGLSDDQLRALGEHGGLVGLAFYPEFLGERGSVDEALRHIDHIVSIAGEDSISIGSDWGVTEMGELVDHASLAVLVAAVEDNYGAEVAEKFEYANAEDFLRDQLPQQ